MIRSADPGSILPRRRPVRGDAGGVVDVGGLRGRLAGAAADAYVRAVVLLLVEELIRAGHVVATLCGNLSAWACADLTAMLPGAVRTGPARTTSRPSC
ncbi:hypothetical protein ACIQVT_12950 [Streptomyces sp. NPDC100445]|uniref:hypothetical protein n=1 Tax=Streptomyces sp. NPDC100445 TaxID=3366102 RepID=UPI00381888A5